MNKSYNGFIFEDKNGSDYLIVIQVEEGRHIGIHASYSRNGDSTYYSNAQFVKFPYNIKDLMASINVTKGDFIRVLSDSEIFFRDFTYQQCLGGLEAAVTAQNVSNGPTVIASAATMDLEYRFYNACDKLFARPLSDLRGLTLGQSKQK